MNYAEMMNMLTMASAPVIDFNAPLPIQITPAGRARVIVDRHHAKRAAEPLPTNEDYEPSPYDGTYSED